MKRTWILELFISIENTRPRGFYIGFGTETARIPGFADIQHTFHSIFNLPSFCTPWAKIGLYKFGTVQKISCTDKWTKYPKIVMQKDGSVPERSFEIIMINLFF